MAANKEVVGRLDSLANMRLRSRMKADKEQTTAAPIELLQAASTSAEQNCVPSTSMQEQSVDASPPRWPNTPSSWVLNAVSSHVMVW